VKYKKQLLKRRNCSQNLKNILFQEDSYDKRKYIVDEFDKERGLG